MEPWLILALAVVCVGVLTGVVPSRNSLMAAAMVLVAGLAFGPIFPTIMTILLGHFPHRLHGRAVGLLFAIGGIGWTVIPILIGAYARRTSVPARLRPCGGCCHRDDWQCSGSRYAS